MNKIKDKLKYLRIKLKEKNDAYCKLYTDKILAKEWLSEKRRMAYKYSIV